LGYSFLYALHPSGWENRESPVRRILVITTCSGGGWICAKVDAGGTHRPKSYRVRISKIPHPDFGEQPF